MVIQWWTNLGEKRQRHWSGEIRQWDYSETIIIVVVAINTIWTNAVVPIIVRTIDSYNIIIYVIKSDNTVPYCTVIMNYQNTKKQSTITTPYVPYVFIAILVQGITRIIRVIVRGGWILFHLLFHKCYPFQIIIIVIIIIIIIIILLLSSFYILNYN